MSTTVQTYLPLTERFGAVVDSLSPADWRADSPCEGWTAADVLAHVIDTQRDFFARHVLDLGERGDVEADPAAAWRGHDEAVRRLFRDETVVDRDIEGFFGPTTLGQTLLTFYGFDLVAHGWDIAGAAGRELRFHDAELDLLESAIAGFGEHLYTEGICAPAVTVPDDADRQVRVLARLGRRADAPMSAR